MFGILKNKKEKNGIVLNNPQKMSMEWGGKTLTLETGRFAKQASGSVMVTYGETAVLGIVVASKTAVEGQDFFPLSVDYVEKMSAVGKIPGSFNRREGQLSEDETLKSRLIDRPIRPLFPDNFKNETQIQTYVYGYDKQNSPDIVAMIAASAALAISGVPFKGPIGAARVGYANGDYIFNPINDDRKDTMLDLIVAGTKEGVLMVESEAQELSEDVMLGAVEAGFKFFQPVIDLIQEFKAKFGKPDWEVAELPEEYISMQKDFEKRYTAEVTEALTMSHKLERLSRLDEIVEEAIASLGDDVADLHKKWAKEIIDHLTGHIMRTNILQSKPRIDGRDNKTVRPIEVEVGLLPRTHGSALFTRGETQALVSVTLGGQANAKLIDDMDGKRDQNFLLHYNFPSFSVGECGRLKSPGRREIGHGKLAWRAIHPMLPSQDEFDYVIRIISDILESNGSSSMATVCGSTLALMDAGVPLKKPVAGIAMGLVKEGKDFAVLTDILGDEDHLGDMDFKVTGTDSGVTALQMDIKITSITFEIMKQALKQAKEGRLHILGIMTSAIKEPRKELSKYAPQTVMMKINTDKIREVIGKGGSVIQDIIKKTNTAIDIADDGTIKITANDIEDINQAKAMINNIVAEPEVGQIYEGEVVSIKDFGAFVKFFGSNEGLVHISEITGERLETMKESGLKEGQKVKVKFQGFDKRGKIKLTMVGVKQD